MAKEQADFAAARAVEATIQNDGSTVVTFEGIATSEEAARGLTKALEQFVGGKAVHQTGGRKSVAFSSNCWGGSNWEPKGPTSPGVQVDQPRNNPILS